MRRAIVTGGGGFVGRAVVQKLLARGVETAVVGRNLYPDLEARGVKLRRGDIRDLDFLVASFHGSDAVFHTAAKAGVWGSREEYFTINVTGTEHVIAACRAAAVPVLVHTSTPSVVFRGGDLQGAKEDAPYADRFLCHYAETKVLAEKAVLAASGEGLLTTALRPHLVWGPGDTNLIPRLVERGRKGLLKKVGKGGNLVDISYIDNVADAHLLAADNLESAATAAGRPYFISQGAPVDLWRWIDRFFGMIGVDPVRKSVGLRKARAAGALLEGIYGVLRIEREPLMTRFLAEQLAHSHWFSIEAARRDLGYHPTVSTEEGMRRTARWVRADEAPPVDTAGST